MYECVLISAFVLRKLVFISLSVYPTQVAHVWGSWRSSAARPYEKNADPWCRVSLECDIVQEHARHYYICSAVNTGCAFHKSRRYSRAIISVMLLECDIVQEHVRHYYSCSPVDTGCTFHKSRRCSGTIFPVIVYVIREDAIPISICVLDFTVIE